MPSVRGHVHDQVADWQHIGIVNTFSSSNMTAVADTASTAAF